MAEKKDVIKDIHEKDRRETRSESLIHTVLHRTLSGSEEHHSSSSERLRHRSYSQNDSAEYARRIENNQSSVDGPRRMSLTELLLGRRSFMNNQVVDQTLREESSSLESLSNLDKDKEDEKVTVTESQEESATEVQSEEIQSSDSVFIDNGNSTEGLSTGGGVTREITQNDHLNKRLLGSLLTRINNITFGDSNNKPNEGDASGNREPGGNSPRDYNVLYTDDFLLDHICRKLDQKK